MTKPREGSRPPGNNIRVAQMQLRSAKYADVGFKTTILVRYISKVFQRRSPRLIKPLWNYLPLVVIRIFTGLETEVLTMVIVQTETIVE